MNYVENKWWIEIAHILLVKKYKIKGHKAFKRCSGGCINGLSMNQAHPPSTNPPLSIQLCLSMKSDYDSTGNRTDFLLTLLYYSKWTTNFPQMHFPPAFNYNSYISLNTILKDSNYTCPKYNKHYQNYINLKLTWNKKI